MIMNKNFSKIRIDIYIIRNHESFILLVIDIIQSTYRVNFSYRVLLKWLSSNIRLNNDVEHEKERRYKNYPIKMKRFAHLSIIHIWLSIWELNDSWLFNWTISVMCMLIPSLKYSCHAGKRYLLKKNTIFPPHHKYTMQGHTQIIMLVNANDDTLFYWRNVLYVPSSWLIAYMFEYGW